MSKWKLNFTRDGSTTTVGEYSTKEQAIDVGTKHLYGSFALDNVDDRRQALETLGYTFIGCNDGLLELVEVE